MESTLESSLSPLFLSHSTFNPPANHINSIFKIYPESDHFSPLPPLPSWSKPPSFLTWIIKIASYPLSLPPCLPHSSQNISLIMSLLCSKLFSGFLSLRIKAEVLHWSVRTNMILPSPSIFPPTSAILAHSDTFTMVFLLVLSLPVTLPPRVHCLWCSAAWNSVATDTHVAHQFSVQMSPYQKSFPNYPLCISTGSSLPTPWLSVPPFLPYRIFICVLYYFPLPGKTKETDLSYSLFYHQSLEFRLST